jgi:predicted nucleotidyltransferase
MGKSTGGIIAAAPPALQKRGAIGAGLSASAAGGEAARRSDIDFLVGLGGGRSLRGLVELKTILKAMK